MKEKMKMLEGIPIFSRVHNCKIFVSNEMFYIYGPIPAPVVNDNPLEYQVDGLCDDMFFEEFGIEPTDQTIKEITEKLLGDFGNIN